MERCVMVDIETLHNKDPKSVILSLGAVSFDINEPEKKFDDEFQGFFNWEDQLANGRTKSKSTIAWWKDQDKAVRAKQFGGSEKLGDGLARFDEWITKQGKVKFYYAWNVSFDMPIIQDAMIQYGIESDFVNSFWKRQCAASISRQIEHAAGQKWMVKNMKDEKFKEFGSAHDALTDCKVQVEVLKDLLTR